MFLRSRGEIFCWLLSLEYGYAVEMTGNPRTRQNRCRWFWQSDGAGLSLLGHLPVEAIKERNQFLHLVMALGMLAHAANILRFKSFAEDHFEHSPGLRSAYSSGRGIAIPGMQ
jgi:hypothetical protein